MAFCGSSGSTLTMTLQAFCKPLVAQGVHLMSNNNSGQYLPTCSMNEYWNDDSCKPCHTIVGCVRGDISCNLCNDQLCETCEDPFTCQSCIDNASSGIQLQRLVNMSLLKKNPQKRKNQLNYLNLMKKLKV